MAISERLSDSPATSPLIRPKYREDKAHMCSVCHCRGEDPADIEFEDQEAFVEHWDESHW